MEVKDRLLVLAANTVIISNNATRFRPILVDLDSFMSEMCHFSFLLAHEEQIRIHIEVLKAVRVSSQNLLEDFDSFVYIALVVISNGNLRCCVKAFMETSLLDFFEQVDSGLIDENFD